MVDLLVRHGANVFEEESINGDTPLGTIAQNCGTDECVKAAERLIDLGVDVDHRGGNTPLMWAAIRGHRLMVRLLIERGADVNYKIPRFEITALDMAIKEKHSGVVRLLRQHGARCSSYCDGPIPR